MTGQSNDSQTGEIERVETSEDDYSDLTDYLEPGVEPDEPEADETETDEGEGGEEGRPEGGQDPEPDPDEAAKEALYAEHDAVVRLSDGTEAKVSDLIEGRMLKSDHTRKTQEVAQQRKAVEADASRIERITQTFIDHLAQMIPAEPDTSLALKDPNAYTRQKAQYDAAIAQVQKLIEIGNQPKQITDAMSDADRQSMLAEENRLLTEAFPQVGTAEGRQKFWNEVSETAIDLGFTAEELSQVTDHRVLKLAHWARKGMAAEKAREAAKAKAAKAPPATPQKPGQGAGNAGRNADAMRKLSRTGSLRDALAVDFD